MKGFLLVGLLLVVIQLTLTQELKCHRCKYVEGKEGAACEKTVDDMEEVTCTNDEEFEEPHFYCAKWVNGSEITGNEDDKLTVIRDCYVSNVTLPAEQLQEDCNQGMDLVYGNATHFNGLLCLCAGELCNSGVMTSLHIALGAIGFLTFKLIQ